VLAEPHRRVATLTDETLRAELGLWKFECLKECPFLLTERAIDSRLG
jgi:hypothetical protein